MLKKITMKQWFIFLTILCILTGCDGYYRLTGTIYKYNDNIKIPLDSVSVQVLVGTYWLKGSTKSDTVGHYQVSCLKHPPKEYYNIVFSKHGFATDTIKMVVPWNWGTSIETLDHVMIRLK